jgi:hypothetical protein
VAYGDPLGVELHRTVVVTSQVANREKEMSQTGSNKDVVKVDRGLGRTDAPTKVTRMVEPLLTTIEEGCEGCGG